MAPGEGPAPTPGHLGPSPAHWEPTLAFPCLTLSPSVTSEVDTAAVSIDWYPFLPGRHSPGTGGNLWPGCLPSASPLAPTGHLARAGCHPFTPPPFSLQKWAGALGGLFPRDTCACAGHPSPPQQSCRFQGWGGVGVLGPWLPSWGGRGNQGATGQWVMNYSETPDAWPEQGAG